MTLHRVAIPSPNYSSRGGARVTTIVCHTAQGARSYQSLGNFFQNPRAGVSSHVGIDDSRGVIGEYVRRDYKSWAASAANPWSVQAELCAFAEWDLAEWNRHPVMLENTAAWIAEEAAHFGIPIVGLDSAGAQNPNVRGVCQHNDLGRMGGGHWDCGPNFPFQRVLDMARGSAPSPPEEDMPLSPDDLNAIRLVSTAASEDAARVMWGAPAGASPAHFQMIVVDKIASVVVDRLSKPTGQATEAKADP